MAGDNNEPKNSFVVLYLLVVLLGLTLAVTIFVFSHKTDMFPVYVPVAPSASLNGYSAIETQSTGKLPIRTVASHSMVRATLDMSEHADSGGNYTITVQTTSPGFDAPTHLSAVVSKKGVKDATSFLPVFVKASYGIYVAKVKFPSSGTWDVDLKIDYVSPAQQGARHLEFSRAFIVK